MKYTKNFIQQFNYLTFILLAMSVICLSTGCKDEPKDPTISELRVCNESDLDNLLCENNVASFDEDTPKIYVSGVFDNIDQTTIVTYTLFGKDSNDNWINIFSTSTSPSDQGTFEDDVVRFRMNVFFKKNDDVQWVKTDYRVEAEIAGAQADDSIEFTIE